MDTHNDLPWLIREFAGSDVLEYDLRKRAPHETDLGRLREGQVSAQFRSVWIPSVDSGSARLQLDRIDLARRMIAAYPEAQVLATKSADVEAAHRAGKIASFLGGENGRAFENSLGTMRAYYDLGMRYMTLTHGRRTDWADSATDEAKLGGLSAFGKEVVREMNRLGMLVDISHVSPDVMNQVLDLSEAPVIFSHSSARAVTDHPRNVPGRRAPAPSEEWRRGHDHLHSCVRLDQGHEMGRTPDAEAARNDRRRGHGAAFGGARGRGGTQAQGDARRRALLVVLSLSTLNRRLRRSLRPAPA